MSGDKIRMAVIGVGHMGRFHAQKVAALREAELAAVVSPGVSPGKQGVALDD